MCTCKKRLVNKLVEECTQNIEETKLVEKNENKHKYSSCTLYVLFSIFFTITVGTGSHFLCFYWYLKKMFFVLSLVPALEQQFTQLINGKSQTNRDRKLNLLFLQRHNKFQKFQIKLVKN